MAQVVFEIDPKTGEKKITVEGVKGGSCTDITAGLVKGNKVVSQDNTCEMYEGEVRPDYLEQGTDDSNS